MIRKPTIARRAAIAALAALVVSACAPTPRTATTSDFIDAIATVRAVDVDGRLMALETSSGDAVVLRVAPKVRNLADVKPGDRLRIRYSRAIAARVVKSAAPVVVSERHGSKTTLDPGARPTASASREMIALYRVDAINTAANRVVITGPDGLKRTVQVVSPEMREHLRTLKAGDTVEVTLTEAAAISIEPAE